MIKDDIGFIADAHDNHSLSPEKRFRKSDTKMPYYVHPIWCAMTIASEDDLDEKTKHQGILALLYHDVLEDTTAQLPDHLSDEVKDLVKHLTFPSGNIERKEIWNKPPVVRLYKLYDKTNNLLSTKHLDHHMLKIHKEILARLIEDVEKNFGKLNITKIARTLL